MSSSSADYNYTIDISSSPDPAVTLGPIYTNSSWNGTWSTGSGNYSITGAGSTMSLPVHINNSGRIECTGENADLILNGKSVKTALEAIEERLAILHPNPELEKEWAELKELGDRYRTLETEIKAKMKVWDTLKKTDF